MKPTTLFASSGGKASRKKKTHYTRKKGLDAEVATGIQKSTYALFTDDTAKKARIDVVVALSRSHFGKGRPC